MRIGLRMDLTCDDAFGFSGEPRSHDPWMNAIHSHVRIHLLQDPKKKEENNTIKSEKTWENNKFHFFSGF